MTDQDLRAALYARVSSEQQADAGTIASQVDALKGKVCEDGLTIDDELCFVDDGYSGASLARPGLERLRDVAATGAVDRVYVHSPRCSCGPRLLSLSVTESLHSAGDA